LSHRSVVVGPGHGRESQLRRAASVRERIEGWFRASYHSVVASSLNGDNALETAPQSAMRSRFSWSRRFK
jgi:hypothetical protein